MNYTRKLDKIIEKRQIPFFKKEEYKQAIFLQLCEKNWNWERAASSHPEQEVPDHTHVQNRSTMQARQNK